MRTTMINKNKGMKRPISDEFLDELMMGAVNYIDDDFLDRATVDCFRNSPPSKYDIDTENPIFMREKGYAGSIQVDDFYDYLPEEFCSDIDDEFLDELMMGAVNYIDDDFLDKKVTASFRMPTKTITERIFEAIVQKIERPAISVASCGSFSLNVERKCNVLEPIILMYCSCDNTNFFHESMEEQLNKVIEVSGDDMYLSYLADIWKNLSIPKIGCSIQDDEFEKVFHLPFTTQWEKIYAECDGNSYLINSYNGNNYIQTSYIKNNFICVPQKASYKFNTAKIDVERIDISSITIPASITSVYMKVRSCEKLFDISFIDFSLMRGSRKIKDLWVEISNCENLKYIRFPMGTYSFSKLLITECASLEDVYIPGKVVKSSTNNISLDRRSCPQIKIISDDDSIVEYAEDTNIPIRA